MERYELNQYYSKMKFWKLFGNQIRIYDVSREKLYFFVKQKAFKLKEAITVFADESMQEELLKIDARSIIDFSASYDVTDVKTGQRIGTLRRKGLKSIFRDAWEILDSSENVIGKIEEDSMLLALIRRFLSNLVPQKFSVFIGESQVALFKQTFNPFVPQLLLDFSADLNKRLDRRLGIAAAILLQVIEGRQKS